MEKLSDYVEDATDYVQKSANRIAHAGGEIAETLGEKGEELLNAEQKMVKQCRNCVRANPLTSVFLALAGGYLLTRLFRTR
jgi:ElaB/YqjD/DUF883 family membrane-anchored ribosome-binding protein